jgi:hypothetical protein
MTSNYFQPGEIFKILWPEPTGQSANERLTDLVETDASTTEPFYAGIRRFIIVATDPGHHSTCVPILTYEHRGCRKKGVDARSHGIIFESSRKHKRKPPKPLKGEPHLGFRPVPAELYGPGEKLAPESRVNYSKLVTVEHNVKVLFIGRISDEYMSDVQEAVNACWEKKFHESRKPRRSK